MRCGVSVSLTGHTGHSEEIHSPEEWANTVVNRTRPASLSSAVVCTAAISCRPRLLRTISSPLDKGAYRKVRLGIGDAAIEPVSDFSGLVSSPCTLASAAAIAPIVSLERCMAALHAENVKADRPGFGSLCPYAV